MFPRKAIMRILQISDSEELKHLMQNIKVDNYGIKIMAPKGIAHIIKINSLSCIAANILKQEMLSLGADAAVSKYTLTGRTRKTDCVLLGNIAQLSRLTEKLKRQPFGLNRLASMLVSALANYEKRGFDLNLGSHKLHLADSHSRIMGIMNLTPDSFSGDGLYSGQGKFKLSDAVIFAQKLAADGADIIDAGGESSRPGARRVPLKEEIARTIPVIKILAKCLKIPISIDTSKEEVAYQALDNGAVIVNDISGLRDPKMAKTIAKFNAGVVIMHMKGTPRRMQNNPAYGSLIDELIEYFTNAIEAALSRGIKKDKIIIDPGIGFGKTIEHNLSILKRLRELKILGCPILIGPSRKSFIGQILKNSPQDRISGTIAACCMAVKNGAHIVRAHDVKEVKEALKVSDAILNA